MQLSIWRSLQRGSKTDGAVSVNEYRAEGYLPHAFRNYLGLLGWTPSSGEEILGLSEMIKQFDLKDIHKSGAIFDVEKLRWFNRQYLRRMPVGEFAKKSFEILHNSLVQKDLSWSDGIAGKLVPLIAERISVWKDLAALASGGEFDYFFFAPTPEAEKIPNKNSNAHDAAEYLTHVRDTLAVLSDEDFTETGIKNMLWNYATKVGRGAVLWPLRYALSGKERSPDPFVIASIVGKKETLERIETAIGHLQAV